MEGICPIANDVDYATFLFDAYGTDGKNYVYVDHVGAEIEEWFGDEVDEEDECDSYIMGGDNEDESDNLMDVGIDSTSETVVMNKTTNDDFLSKLCASDEEDDLHTTLHDEGESDPCGKVHVIFDESLHWNKQKPILRYEIL